MKKKLFSFLLRILFLVLIALISTLLPCKVITLGLGSCHDIPDIGVSLDPILPVCRSLHMPLLAQPLLPWCNLSCANSSLTINNKEINENLKSSSPLSKISECMLFFKCHLMFAQLKGRWGKGVWSLLWKYVRISNHCVVTVWQEVWWGKMLSQIFKSFLSRWKIHLNIFDIEDRTTHTFSVGALVSEQFSSYLCDFCRQMKACCDFSGGLKHTFDGHQQMHGAETNAQVALESCWEYKEGMGRGQADDENPGT